jgi:hypothetical protein
VATRLGIYSGALRECGERKLASLSDDYAPRHMLDDVWSDGFIRDVLGQGQFSFATRSIELAADADTEVQFGYAYAFVQPTDIVRTVAFCSDERFDTPMTSYQVEAGFWYADVDPLFVRYVSDDADYGGDLSMWPEEFTRYAELRMAWRILPRLTGSKADRAQIAKDAKRALLDAKSSDAMEKPTQFTPRGMWVSSRAGRRGTNGDRGSRSRLIG